MNERSTDTLIRSRVREKESGLDESPVQSRRRRPELLLGIALVVLGALGGVVLQQRGDDSVLVVHERRGERGAWRMYRASPDDRDAQSGVGVSGGTNRAGATPHPRS